MKPSIRSLALALFTFLQASVSVADAPLIWGPNNTAKLLNSGDLVAKNGYIYPNIPSAFTVGSVPFASASSTLSQDNAKFFWDDSQFFLGLGTNSPDHALTINSDQPASIQVNNSIGSSFSEWQANVGGSSGRLVFTGPSFGDPDYGTNSLVIHAEDTNGDVRIYPGQTASHQTMFSHTGDVGIGTSSPLSKLHVSSTVRSDGDFISIAGNHQTWNSPAVTKAVSFGMNKPGDPITDDFIFSLFSGGWSERMRLTQAGNLGIGTNAPTKTLTVVGDIGFGISGSPAILNSGGSDNFHISTFSNTPNPNWDIGYGNGSGGTDYTKEYLISNAGFIRAKNSSFTVDGNVGIGTTSPAYLLDIGATGAKFQVDSSGNTVRISDVPTKFPLTQGGVGTILTNDGAGNLTWGTAGGGFTGTTGSVPFVGAGGTLTEDNTKFFWDDTNNRLGIGTNTPTQPLEIITAGSDGMRVVGSSSTNFATFEAVNDANHYFLATTSGSGVSTGFLDSNQALLYTDAPNGLRLTTESTVPMEFRTNNTEAMRITGAQNVGIGTTAPISKLSVENGASVGGSVPGGSGFTVSGTGANNRFVTADGDKTLNFQVTGASNFGELSSYDFGTSSAFPLYLNANGGNVGVGSLNAASSFAVTGNASIGSGYNAIAAPTNGLIVQGNVGIGTSSPAKQLDVSGKFQVDSNGNILEINNVATSFPASQGASSTVLTNDGSGNLTWDAPASAVTSLTGEATGTGPGATAVTLNNAAVIQKVLTGFSPTPGQIAATDNILQAAQKNDANWSLQFFGDGSDGAFSAASGTTTLTRDMYYSSLTLTGTAILRPVGFRVFVSGTCFLAGAQASAINFNGNAGGAGATAGTGGTGGANIQNGSIAGSAAGVTGGAGGVAAGVQGGAGSSASPQQGGANGATLVGGTGASGAGGAARAAVSPAGALSIHRWMVDELKAGSLLTGGISGNAGNGGGGDGTSGAGGGGSGAGGGNLWLACQTINRDVVGNPGVISVNGGSGGAGGSATAGNRGGGSGASGAGGGWAYVAYRYLAGSTQNNLIQSAGGAGGAGGNGFGTGTGGGGGGGGNGGRITLYNVQTGVASETFTGTGGVGGAASGVTGGTAGTSGVNNVSL